MTFVNLLGNPVCPDYPTKCLVDNSVSRMLRKRLESRSGHGFPIPNDGVHIELEGFVGSLAKETDIMAGAVRVDDYGTSYFSDYDDAVEAIVIFLSLFLGGTFVLTIYGVLSGFHSNESTFAQ